MYFDEPVTGKSLPEKILSLTFDDGPGQTEGAGAGPRTLEVAEYLAGQGIPATFFMVGKYASHMPGILSRIEGLGHLIGNHTYDHPRLPQHAAAGGDVVSQVTRTDSMIRNWVDGPVIFFRPPYGAWDSGVAASLNANMTAALSHMGPIGWIADGDDFAAWESGTRPELCAESYIRDIETKGHRGIVLMHDCTADIDVIKERNRTFELIKFLIPLLKQRGYKFVRLDAVPEIRMKVRHTLRVALRGPDGLYVSPQDGGGEIRINGPAIGPWEPLVVEDLYAGKVALRAANGRYVSPQDGGGAEVLADGPAVGEWEPLDLISLGPYRVAFRTITGHFLTAADDGFLKALNCIDMQPSSVFTYEYLP